MLLVVALVGGLLGFLTGCTSLGPAKVAANGLRTALHDAAPKLRAECVEPFKSDATTPAKEARRLLLAYDRSGCSRRLRAYDNARRVHLLVHATVGAYELGECVGVSRSVEYCDLAGVIADAARVRAELEKSR